MALAWKLIQLQLHPPTDGGQDRAGLTFHSVLCTALATGWEKRGHAEGAQQALNCVQAPALGEKSQQGGGGGARKVASKITPVPECSLAMKERFFWRVSCLLPHVPLQKALVPSLQMMVNYRFHRSTCNIPVLMCSLLASSMQFYCKLACKLIDDKVPCVFSVSPLCCGVWVWLSGFLRRPY